MNQYSRSWAAVLLSVILLPGIFSGTLPNTPENQAVPNVAADLPAIDLPVTLSQDFEGDLNQSIQVLGNASLVPYRVDVNVTGLNQTGNRLSNGNFIEGLNGWQTSNEIGKNFTINPSGPEGSRSLQGNLTGLWNTTKLYPLNTTDQIDQFDEPNQWFCYNGQENVTAEIDRNPLVGTTGNYLNISWWKDRLSSGNQPQIGLDVGSANRSFVYNGSSDILAACIKFSYRADIVPTSGGGGTPNATIRCNVTVTNPNNLVKNFENAIVETRESALGHFIPLSLSSGLESIFGVEGTYNLTFSVSIQQFDVQAYPDNVLSGLLFDNVSIDVNYTLGTFNEGDAICVSQDVELNQVPLTDVKATIHYCASSIPTMVNRGYIQLGFAIDNKWFNLSGLDVLTPNVWDFKEVTVGKGNFSGADFSFKVGLMSFNASEIFPNESLVIHFANLTLKIATNASVADLHLVMREYGYNATLAIQGDSPSNVNASLDLAASGGFSLGTAICVYINSTEAGGIKGRVTVWAWTWREATWQWLNKTFGTLETYLATLPGTYASQLTQIPISFTYVNFARALESANYYLARTYAVQVGPNALYTTSIANASARSLWATLNNPSAGTAIPSAMRTYIEEIYDAQQTSRSLVSYFQADQRWLTAQSSTSPAKTEMHTALKQGTETVPSNLNATKLLEWVATLYATISACTGGESWLVPESTWNQGTSRMFVVGYSQLAVANLQRDAFAVYPISGTSSQFVGGAPLLASLAQTGNETTSCLYLTQAEFRFAAVFNALAGFFAESASIAALVEGLPAYLTTALNTVATKEQYVTNAQVTVQFTSEHFENSSLAIRASWNGNASRTSAWITLSAVAQNISSSALLWEQVLQISDLSGEYSYTCRWMPSSLPPAVNELYVENWVQNWTAAIVVRANLWVGGTLVSSNLSTQEELDANWFDVTYFAGLSNETLYITPKIGETTYTLTLPAWEGLRNFTISNFEVQASIISRTSTEITLQGVNTADLLPIASCGNITVQFSVPTKPIGHQVEILLTLTGVTAGNLQVQQDVLLIISIVDVVSPTAPISEALFLAALAIIGTVASGMFLVRWQKFLFFRAVNRPKSRTYDE